MRRSRSAEVSEELVAKAARRFTLVVSLWPLDGEAWRTALRASGNQLRFILGLRNEC